MSATERASEVSERMNEGANDSMVILPSVYSYHKDDGNEYAEGVESDDGEPNEKQFVAQQMSITEIFESVLHLVVVNSSLHQEPECSPVDEVSVFVCVCVCVWVCGCVCVRAVSQRHQF